MGITVAAFCGRGRPSLFVVEVAQGNRRLLFALFFPGRSSFMAPARCPSDVLRSRPILPVPHIPAAVVRILAFLFSALHVATMPRASQNAAQCNPLTQCPLSISKTARDRRPSSSRRLASPSPPSTGCRLHRRVPLFSPSHRCWTGRSNALPGSRHGKRCCCRLPRGWRHRAPLTRKHHWSGPMARLGF